MLPELAMTVTERALELGDRATLERLLAELTRAAAASGNAAAAALSGLLHERLGDLLQATLDHPDGPLPQRLTTALQQIPVPAAAASVLDRLPEYSLALADLAAMLTDQALTHHRELAKDDPDVHLSTSPGR